MKPAPAPLGWLARVLLVLCLVAGILLPRAGAILTELIPGIDRMVICTGTEMITLTIGPDGEPIQEIDSATPHCVMADGADHIASPLPYWQALTLSDAPTPAYLHDPLADLTPLSHLRPVRAPLPFPSLT